MKFAVEVPVRWSDMDAYGHVNHARTVTLLEDARTKLVFEEMARRGLRSFLGGLVVSRVVVDYLAPIVYQDSPIEVVLWVDTVKAASFVLRYEIRPRGADRLLARAETTMVPYDVVGARLRRLTDDERAALRDWTADDGTPSGAAAAPNGAVVPGGAVAPDGAVAPGGADGRVGAGVPGGAVAHGGGGAA